MVDRSDHGFRATGSLVALGLLTLCLSPAQGAEPERRQAVRPEPPSHADAIRAIAADIAALKTSFPQLADFDVDKHCHPDRLMIEYGHKTHPPKHRAGWTGGVPNPDPDGVWFYIDFHDPKSTRQIHTQPVVLERRRSDKRVMFLILEGEKTKALAGHIDRILARHGVTRPQPDRKP